MVIILAGSTIVVVTSTLIAQKKRDIAIMRSLGTIPRLLYSFYLKEAILVFLVGFVIGYIFGLTFYGITIIIFTLLDIQIAIYIDIVWVPIFFLCTLAAIYLVAGYVIRRLGQQNIQWIFSKDIPYDFDAQCTLSAIPRWLSKLGFNFKSAMINLIRRKKDFTRYFVLFGVLITTLLTLGIGIFVLSTSSDTWIGNAQGENIIAVGHKDVVNNYYSMYQKYYDLSNTFNETELDFTKPEHIFDTSIISSLENMEGVQKVDERLLVFKNILEINGTVFFPNQTYAYVGKNRNATVPILGVDHNDLVQEFEVDGQFISDESAYINVTIGDSLAAYKFDYPLEQRLQIGVGGKRFGVGGVVLDSLYNGFSVYFNLSTLNIEMNNQMGLPFNTINLILIKIESSTFTTTMQNIQREIQSSLGNNFIVINMNGVFSQNLTTMKILNTMPLVLIVLFSLVSFLALYNYQKVAIHEKIKDFLIMKAIGSKNKYIRRIMFFENLIIIIASSLYALAISMVLNIIVLFERVYLPPIYIPFLIYLAFFIVLLVLNSLSLLPLMKKLKKFSIKDFEMF